MPIIVNLDVMLAKRKVKSYELARAVGITDSNLSLLKSGKVKGVRFGTLAAICRYLECEPGDILGYERSDADLAHEGADDVDVVDPATGQDALPVDRDHRQVIARGR